MLFEPFHLRTMQIANRLVMSPLTRSRAVHDNTANALRRPTTHSARVRA
jgi:N-ethylmaleimide reductase